MGAAHSSEQASRHKVSSSTSQGDVSVHTRVSDGVSRGLDIPVYAGLGKSVCECVCLEGGGGMGSSLV